MPKIEILQPGFSTADAEYPEFRIAHGELHLLFKDWREQSVHILFSEVCAFRWQEAEELLVGEPYDGACEVIQSEWLARHIRDGALPEESKHHHLRFNFNACGQLEVLCASFKIVA
jgi:hypothetical protein